jgi:taurine dioxygenase
MVQSAAGLCVSPLGGGAGEFGSVMHVPSGVGADEFVERASQAPSELIEAVVAGRGLLLIRGLHDVEAEPARLVRLGELFGVVVDGAKLAAGGDHNATARGLHDDVPAILDVTNITGFRGSPSQTEPPFEDDGSIPVTYPRRGGWHSDNQFFRPPLLPADYTLFHCVIPAPEGTGQTLYADGIGAFAAMSPEEQEQLEQLHAMRINSSAVVRLRRREEDARAGLEPLPPAPHEAAQPMKLVRTHPLTGEKALVVEEPGFLDWAAGPVAELSKGPDGDGAELIRRLMAHVTEPRFVHVQEWQAGDLVVYDNRCLMHTASWYDSDHHPRRMWRMTVAGNPGQAFLTTHGITEDDVAQFADDLAARL